MELNINKKSIIALSILSSSFLFANYSSKVNDNNVVRTSSEPIGTVVIWAKSDIPTGWLEMNGQDVTENASLVNIYGNNLPDLRGVFVRGYGGNSGALGEFQEQSMKSHGHTASFVGNALPGHTHTYSALAANQESHGNKSNDAANDNRGYYNFTSVSAGTPTGSISVGNSGTSELRPINVALKYIVKAEK